MSLPPDFIGPRHQTNWDWRAACNFMFGGTGSGLVIVAAVLAPAQIVRVSAAAALLLVGAGLFFVWLEIGRPFRAINVFRHPSTSWMTREAIIAPLLFGFGALALWRGSSFAWTAALAGAAFLFCQAQILKASRGIPAWRTAAIVPLIIATGLAEGAGLLIVVAALYGISPAALPIALFVLLLGRGVAWRAYRAALREEGAPEQTFIAVGACVWRVSILGQWTPALLALLALVPGGDALPSHAAALAAGVFAVYGGWLMKFTIVARAAYNQGFALPKLPVRGQPMAVEPSMRNAQPGWRAADSAPGQS
jgi:phenylacetyl-CoA:acceptor oxidoreductase subunit 2